MRLSPRTISMSSAQRQLIELAYVLNRELTRMKNCKERIPLLKND